MNLTRKQVSPIAPIGSASMCLLRLGEACDHRCPMCSNSGRPELRHLPSQQAIARFEHLRELGFRRLMLTGGEPTLHPIFWELVERAAAAGIRWDLNTHGGHIGERAQEAVTLGLQRVILSLHDHEEGPACVMSGIGPARHHQVVASVDLLLTAGARVHLNRVLGRPNLGRLDAYLRFVAARWGAAIPVKVCFPSTAGKGGGWEGIQIRYEEVGAELRAAVQTAATLGIDLDFEAVPSCVLQDPSRTDLGRAAWGESHYLDERDGRTVHGMAFLESMQRFYGPGCAGCAAFAGCPGISRHHAQTHGVDWTRPFPV